MTQMNLFDELPEQPARRNGVPSLDRFEGALLCSTVGDALGWPTEFLKPTNGHKPQFRLPVKDFVSWEKLVGGKWWGYDERIGQGEYSDDTQLTLAVARSIAETGQFEPGRFAYEELPLWLQYERGGGKSVKEDSWEKMPIGNATSISNATLIIELPERTGRLCGIYQ